MSAPALAAAAPAALADLRPLPGEEPYPRYARLRTLDPTLWQTQRRWRGLVRYDDVRAALHDPRLSSAGTSRVFRAYLVAQLTAEERAAVAPVVATHQAMLIFADGERHRRLRATIQAAMTPTGVARLRPAIEAMVADLLAPLAATGRADLIAALALPLPMRATAALLGLPAADLPDFHRWAADAFSLAGTDGGRPAHALQARRSHDELTAYVARLWRERPDRPPGLLDRLDGDGPRLDEQDRLAIFLSLLSGGFETATNLLGNGLLALLRHPDALAELRENADPALVAGAIEELARYDAPVQLAARVATEPLEIGGKPIRRGEVVECWLGAANRDPDRFPAPDRLELRRRDNQHLAFGHGPHYCIGAALARLQASIVIPAILRQLPELRLAVPADELRWKPLVTFRALAALPVRFRPAPRQTILSRG